MGLISDAVRFALHNRHTIENALLQAYVSALVFTPINSLIRKEFGHVEPTWIKLQPIIESSWSPCTQTLEGSDWVRSVAFSPDGQQIASGSLDCTVKVWDCASGACTQTLEGHSDWVKSVAFSPDGRQIASGSEDRTVKVWDCASGACTQTLEGHSNYVESVAFSPDGRQIASGSEDCTVKVWDCASGACTQTLEGHSSSVESVAFSPDGTQTLEGHSNWIKSVAFSPDGRQIASGSGDRTVKVWDRESGACTQTLEGHSDWVKSVAFSPDGQEIASGSGENDKRVCEPRYSYGYGLSTDQRWISRHEQNVLWLPPDYRPSSSAVWCCPSHISTMSDSCIPESIVALGCRSGRVLVLGLGDHR